MDGRPEIWKGGKTEGPKDGEPNTKSLRISSKRQRIIK